MAAPADVARWREPVRPSRAVILYIYCQFSAGSAWIWPVLISAIMTPTALAGAPDGVARDPGSHHLGQLKTEASIIRQWPGIFTPGTGQAVIAAGRVGRFTRYPASPAVFIPQPAFIHYVNYHVQRAARLAPEQANAVDSQYSLLHPEARP